MKERESIIINYIEGYNNFDVNQMIKDFSDHIAFENVQQDVITDSLQGIEEFKEQAEFAKSFFSSRKQTILSFRHTKELTEIEISYEAILAIDFPNGLNKGELIKLSGKSVFEFSDNLKITKLTDIS